MTGDAVQPNDVCEVCKKPWSEHWGFNCDKPYADRKWKPLKAGWYPDNNTRMRGDEP